MAKKITVPVKENKLYLADPNSTPLSDLMELSKNEVEVPRLAKRMLQALDFSTEEKKEVNRLSYTVDPNFENQMGWSSIFVPKPNTILADTMLKRIARTDDLIATIATTRSNMLGQYGALRPDRMSFGIKTEPKAQYANELSDEFKKELKKKIDVVMSKLLKCGEDLKDGDHLSLRDFFHLQSRNAVIMGRFATERIYRDDPNDPDKKKFAAFRAIDAGTIYRATNQSESHIGLRKQARDQLKKLRKDPDFDPTFDIDRFSNDEYKWIQVIEGQPRQAFTMDECCVVNCYPVTDYELQGYPFTPIDSVISSIVTHLNINTQNKVYFQNGRAARGMLVIQSDDVTERETMMIRQQFQASINGAAAAHRMPVFSVPNDSKINWMPIDSGTRDMEFQYLSDTNCRVILSAFQMAPEEISGLSYLSRGTTSESTSESNNNYNITAARDTGLRPLINIFETFINEQIVPLFDEEVAKYCTVKMLGLEADSAEKESVRLQTDGPIHMSFDEIMERVEKTGVGVNWGGKFPLNPQWQSILDKYMYVDEIRTHFFGLKSDPAFHYVRDPFHFQAIQLKMQQDQMDMQKQQMQQQVAAEQAQGASGGGSAPPEKPKGESGGGDSAQNLPKGEDPSYTNAPKGDKPSTVNQNNNKLENAVSGASKSFGGKN